MTEIHQPKPVAISLHDADVFIIEYTQQLVHDDRYEIQHGIHEKQRTTAEHYGKSEFRNKPVTGVHHNITCLIHASVAVLSTPLSISAFD